MKDVSIGRLQKCVYCGSKRFLLLIKCYRDDKNKGGRVGYDMCVKSLVVNIVGLDRLKDPGVDNVWMQLTCMAWVEYLRSRDDGRGKT